MLQIENLTEKIRNIIQNISEFFRFPRISNFAKIGFCMQPKIVQMSRCSVNRMRITIRMSESDSACGKVPFCNPRIQRIWILSNFWFYNQFRKILKHLEFPHLFLEISGFSKKNRNSRVCDSAEYDFNVLEWIWCEAPSGNEAICKKSRPKVATFNLDLNRWCPDLVHRLPEPCFQTPEANTGGPSESQFQLKIFQTRRVVFRPEPEVELLCAPKNQKVNFSLKFRFRFEICASHPSVLIWAVGMCTIS